MMILEKFENLVLAICETVPPEYLATTKLNKLLWLVDKTAFMRLGKSVTCSAYLRKRKGPVPQDNRDVFAIMQENHILATEQGRWNLPADQMQSVNYRGLKKANMDVFSQEEKDIIFSVINEYGKKPASQLVNLSHDLVWATFEDGDVIPFEAYLSSIKDENNLPEVQQIIADAELEYDE